MLFLFYLVTTCFAVPVEKVHQVLGTKHVPTFDEELLTKFKTSKNNEISKLLIESLADADPDAVRRVKGLVEALIAAGEDERDKYTQDRNEKQTIFDTASAQFAADTVAHTTVAGQLSNARAEVTRLEGLKSDGETAKNEAKRAFDDAVSELNDAEVYLADETTRVDTEKATLEEIRRLLNTLLPEQASGCLGHNGYTHKPDDACYKLHTQKKSWADASNTCQNEGAYLSDWTLENADILFDYVRSGGVVWLGGSDRIKEGNWIWIDGTPVESAVWNNGEPNNWKNEDCLVLEWTGKAVDVQCGRTFDFVCKIA